MARGAEERRLRTTGVTNRTVTIGFSVIVPTFRRPQHLLRCIEGLSRLDFPRDRFEVIVVDDGSPESAEPVVARWRALLDVTLIVQPNAGPASARNRGAASARFSHLAFIDDDCVPRPGWLQGFGRALAEDPHALLGGHTINALPRDVFSAASHQLVTYVCGYYDGRRGRTRFFTSNNMAVCAEDFHAIGGFDSRFSRAAGEDRDLCDRWGARGGAARFVCDAEVLHSHGMNLRAFWRQHYEYGKGAALFRSTRAERDGNAARFEPLSFYVNLIACPLEEGMTARSVTTSMLLVLAQIAGATGYVRSLLQSPSPRSAG